MSAAASSPIVAAQNIETVESPADFGRWFIDTAIDWLPMLVVIVLVFLSLWVVKRLANRKRTAPRQERVIQSLTKVIVVIVGVIAVALVLPWASPTAPNC